MNNRESTFFDDLMTKGMAASQACDSEQALACFVKASEIRPASGIPHFFRGSELVARGDIAAAEAAFANAVLLAPTFPMARFRLGFVLFSSGRAVTAHVIWRSLLELPETDPLPHVVKGFAAAGWNRFEEALAHFHHGLARSTSTPALSSDIHKAIRSIKAQGHGAASTVAGVPEGYALLANFQQQGPAH